MTLDTMVLLANGSYCPVQALTGKTVASTDSGTARVIRVHLFHLRDPTHRLIIFRGNWIMESHIIKNPMTEYQVWLPPDDCHGPLPGVWTQADGRQWWLKGHMQLAEPISNPPRCEDPKGLHGEAVFNIQLDVPTGVFLRGALEVAALGNRVFLRESYPSCHDVLFNDLSRKLAQSQCRCRATESSIGGQVPAALLTRAF